MSLLFTPKVGDILRQQITLGDIKCLLSGNYGASGMKAFLALSESVGICTAVQLTVPQHVNINTDPVFNKTVLELATHNTAR